MLPHGGTVDFLLKINMGSLDEYHGFVRNKLSKNRKYRYAQQYLFSEGHQTEFGVSGGVRRLNE